MLAKANDADVAQHDKFVVTANFLESAFENVERCAAQYPWSIGA